jgi:hypothetical protein
MLRLFVRMRTGVVPWRKDSIGERFPWGLPWKPRRGVRCVCVSVCSNTHACGGLGEEVCPSDEWACAWTQFHTLIVVSPIHFPCLVIFDQEHHRWTKVKWNTTFYENHQKCILCVQMPCVDEVMEPYDNQIKLSTSFREKTCKSVHFDRKTAGGLKNGHFYKYWLTPTRCSQRYTAPKLIASQLHLDLMYILWM